MAGIPTCTSLTPASVTANGGTNVTLTGINYDTATVSAATINGKAVSFTVSSDTALVLTTTQAEEGVATITVTNSSGTLTDATKLTVTKFVQPTRHNRYEGTGTFDTNSFGAAAYGTGLTLADNYGQANKVWTDAETTYRQKRAKIVAVNLNNVRNANPYYYGGTVDIAVPTF